MPPRITVAVPTLAADDALADCLRSLKAQTMQDFDVVVIDNSGQNRVQVTQPHVRVIANRQNVGFGAAINQAYGSTESPYVAALNDDAVAYPGWLEALVRFADQHPRAGMLASQVRLSGTETLDSAGMLLASDGSSKQRGHGEPMGEYALSGEALFPSGSAALYRREMLDDVAMETGAFDETFFLYCEDTDLGLRARWAGWECHYVAEAIVEHRYSHSAGRASAMKAYYVERNRLYMAIKNLPLAMLWRVPLASLIRYLWHVREMFAGRGKGAEYREAGHSTAALPWMVARAHFAALLALPRLWRERRRMPKRISTEEFLALIERHEISLRKVASL